MPPNIQRFGIKLKKLQSKEKSILGIKSTEDTKMKVDYTSPNFIIIFFLPQNKEIIHSILMRLQLNLFSLFSFCCLRQDMSAGTLEVKFRR